MTGILVYGMFLGACMASLSTVGLILIVHHCGRHDRREQRESE